MSKPEDLTKNFNFYRILKAGDKPEKVPYPMWEVWRKVFSQTIGIIAKDSIKVGGVPVTVVTSFVGVVPKKEKSVNPLVYRTVAIKHNGQQLGKYLKASNPKSAQGVHDNLIDKLADDEDQSSP